jgi:uncharacterized spore protein YtfJ
MENNNFLERINSGLGQSATVKNVFGEPIQAGDKTIIPVARIAYGFGGGMGKGKKNKRLSEAGLSPASEESPGEGSGGGGGMYARAKGVYEVSPSGTRFIPACSTKEVLIGVAIGFLVKSLFFSRK